MKVTNNQITVIKKIFYLARPTLFSLFTIHYSLTTAFKLFTIHYPHRGHL
jgi:hypothetical protein